MPLLQEEPGHVVSKCFKKKFDEKSSKANRGEDIALVASNEGQKWNRDVQMCVDLCRYRAYS